MPPALALTASERVAFMQALHAVVAVQPRSAREPWQALLMRMSALLDVGPTDYQFSANVAAIVQKINAISNRRARLYFLHLIHEVHHQRGVGFLGGFVKNDTASFEALFAELVSGIEVD